MSSIFIIVLIILLYCLVERYAVIVLFRLYDVTRRIHMNWLHCEIRNETTTTYCNYFLFQI